MRIQILRFGLGAAIGLACVGAQAQTVRHMEVRKVNGSSELFLTGYYGSTPYEPTPIVTMSDDEIAIVLDPGPYIGYAVGTNWELTVPLEVPFAHIYDIRVCGGSDGEICQAENQVGFLQSWVYPNVSLFRSSFE